MLKIFQYIQGSKLEILSINNIYNVLELGRYEIVYTSKNIVTKHVFVEDFPIKEDNLKFYEDQVILKDHRYFEDYFGYASLNINGEIFLFNIRIEKLKLSEIEEIFIYLWKQEEKLFNLFLSKSTYELDFKRNGFDLGQTSKLLSFIDHFIVTFEKLYVSFDNMPFTVIRKINQTSQYNNDQISPDTVGWLLANFDEINFDNSFKGHHNVINIKGKFGLISTMNTARSKDSFETYENQIILGAFIQILNKLKNLKNDISSNINLSGQSHDTYADFKDLKRIPFIKLFQDSSNLEKKIKKLFTKYSRLFSDVNPRVEKVVLTPVFANKVHYRIAFSLIKNLDDYKFDLFGEFKLLNINKLSRLYEVYNLYIIIDAIKKKLRINLFEITAFSERNDEIIERVIFKSEFFTVRLFFDFEYYGHSHLEQKTSLRRIATTGRANHYKPDYIIEIHNLRDDILKCYVLDAKYSKMHNVKFNYLQDTIQKYILNTGVFNKQNYKISSLSLICPDEQSENIIDSEFFEPTIKLISSRPNSNNKDLIKYIGEILEKNIDENLLSQS